MSVQVYEAIRITQAPPVHGATISRGGVVSVLGSAQGLHLRCRPFLFAKSNPNSLGTCAPLEGRGGDLLPAHREKLSLEVKWRRGTEQSLKRRARAVLGERSTRANYEVEV